MKLKMALCRANQCLWSWESSSAENNRRAELSWGQESQESLLRSVLSHQEILEGLQPWDYSGLFTAWSRRWSYNSFYSHLFGMDVNKSWKENTGKHIHSPRCQSTKRLSVCVFVSISRCMTKTRFIFTAKGILQNSSLFPCMRVEFPRTLCCINKSFPIQSDPGRTEKTASNQPTSNAVNVYRNSKPPHTFNECSFAEAQRSHGPHTADRKTSVDFYDITGRRNQSTQDTVSDSCFLLR